MNFQSYISIFFGVARLLWTAGISCVLCAAPVFAQQESAGQNTSPASVSSAGAALRYPAGSITSVEVANRALADVAAERSAIEARFAADEYACYSRFFANDCREKASERRRLALEQIRAVEVEANAFKRQQRVVERDKTLAEKREKEEREQAERLQREQDEKTRDVQRAAGDTQKQGHAPGRTATRDRVAEHEAKLKRLEKEDADNAAERAENIAAYERKARESRQRQLDVENRKKKKEEKGANRQQTKQ